MQKKWFHIIFAVVLLSMTFQAAPTAAVTGSDEPPSPSAADRQQWTPPLEGEFDPPGEDTPTARGEDFQPIKTRDGRELREDGLWYFDSSEADALSLDSPTSTLTLIGPDQFGYIAEDSYTYQWVDASGGTDTGISNVVTGAGPINIGFDFKFYTNTYSQLYISRNGYISFNNVNLNNSQSYIPDIELPNDVIAPQWGPSDTINYVRYLNDGVSPDRRMIIEWNGLTDDAGTEVSTFQAILHENGDIIFQFKSWISDHSRACTSSGIEDDDGIDGLTLRDMCDYFAAEQAARIYRPASGARVSLFPEAQGGFTQLNAILEYPLTIQNNGDLGADTLDFAVVSAWNLALYTGDGTTLLIDTDGDGAVDTGAMAPGDRITLLARITPPADPTTGDYNFAQITATSSLDPAVTRSSVIKLAYPTTFAQAYFNGDSGAGIYLVNPGVQIESLPAWWTASMGVTETANGSFVYAANQQSYDPGYVSWITALHYIIFNSHGGITIPSTSLTNLSPSAYDVWDLDPALAAAPNGDIGLLWRREVHDPHTGDRSDNLVFAIINEAGELVYGPQQITSNTTLGFCSSDENVPCYHRPQLSVTEDGKYAISYQQDVMEAGYFYDDIYFGTRNGDGSQATALTNLTRGFTLGNHHISPSLTALSGNRFFLAWNSDNLLTFMVFNSSGTVLQPLTTLGTYIRSMDSVQLSDGTLFIAGYAAIDTPEGQRYDVNYLTLDAASYAILTPQTSLPNPEGSGYIGYISVTRDGEANGVITWTGGIEATLYYALVHSDGSVLTPPIAFRSSDSLFLDTSATGYGNTTYSTEIILFTGCEDVTSIPESECLALQALYDATAGDQWGDHSNWNVIGDPSAWYGVMVVAGHVTELNLAGNYLAGTLPPELGDLTYLKVLNFADNYLSGAIPTEMGNLAQLEFLSLYANQLSGAIPSQLGSLTNLHELDLGWNTLSGSIPTSLGSLTNLEYLELYGNQLSGEIPTSLGSLTKLYLLSLHWNMLTGSIPTSLGSLANLHYLDLGGNMLSGPIPTSLGSLINLEYLYLDFNRLSGELPASLGGLTQMRSLALYRNYLEGSLPTTLGNLTNLAYLSLGNNLLSGQIPDEIGALSSLVSLDLRYNYLGGEIPPSIGNLVSLETLELAGNQLTGEIPAETGSLTNLRVLRLFYNDLTGPIPATLGSLTNLEVLDLSLNRLEGEVPEAITNLTRLCLPTDYCYSSWGKYGLDLGYNHLTVPAASQAVTDFLAIKDPDWYLTQAVQETIVGDAGGMLLSNDGLTEIVIPPGAVDGSVTFTLEPHPYPYTIPSYISYIGTTFELTAIDALGNPVTEFAEALILTQSYEDELASAIEENLRLYYQQDPMGSWQDVVTTCVGGSYTRNLDENWLSVPLCHLSLFSLMSHAQQIYLPIIQR